MADYDINAKVQVRGPERGDRKPFLAQAGHRECDDEGYQGEIPNDFHNVNIVYGLRI